MYCASQTPALSHQPSPALLAFVRRQVSQAELYTGPERRGGLRQFLVQPVLVYPADEHFSPVGPSQVMVIRDISPRGLGLVHENPMQSNLILVRISLPGIEALLGANVRWTRPAGPFYHIGCDIDAQFDSIDKYLDCKGC
jgi:PilZ domain